MPFIKTPPAAVVDAFVKDLKAQGIEVDKNTLERDLDRIMAGMLMQPGLMSVLKELGEDDPGVQRTMKELQSSNPIYSVILPTIERHLKEYFQ